MRATPSKGTQELAFPTPRSVLVRPLALGLSMLALFASGAPAAMRVSGEVTLQNGEPVPDASVSLVRYLPQFGRARALLQDESPEVVAEAAVRRDFMLSAPTAGAFVLIARAPGFASAEVPLVPLTSSIALDPIILRRAVPILVTTVDEQGDAITGALVRLVPRSRTNARSTYSAMWSSSSGRTDSRGAVTLIAPRRARFTLAAAAPSFAPVFAPGRRAESERLVLRPGRAQPLSLEVDGGTSPEGALAIDTATQLPLASFDLSGSATVWLSEQTHTIETTSAGGFFAISEIDPGQVGPVLVRLRETPSVHGKVVAGESSEPVSGALVWAEDSSSVVGTRADGHFELPLSDLRSADEVLLIASARGLGQGQAQVGRHAMVEGMSTTLRLTAIRNIVGRVINELGEAIPNALVQIQPTLEVRSCCVDDPDLNFLPIEGETDEEGFFRLEDVAASSFDISASQSGYATEARVAVQAGTGESVDIGSLILLPSTAVEGVVQDPQGEPLEGAQIRAYEIAAGQRELGVGEHGEAAATSGAAGGFLISDLALGRPLELTISLGGYGDVVLQGIRPPTVDPLRVVLTHAVDLEGRTLEEGGDPIGDARVFLQRESASGDSTDLRPTKLFREVASDEEGWFLAPDLSPGTWAIQAWAPGFQPTERQTLELSSSETPPELTLELTPGATLEGKVESSSGGPVTGASIRTQSTTLDLLAATVSEATRAISDSEGRYSVSGLEMKTSTFIVSHQDYRNLVRDVRIDRQQVDHDFLLESGWSIEGTVSDESGGAVQSARVRAFSADQGFTDGKDDVLSLKDGSYSITGLENGTYQVSATREGFATARAPRPIRVNGRSVSGVDLELSRGALLVGDLLGLEVADLSRLSVLAVQADGPVRPLRGISTGDFSYSVRNVRAGRWRVVGSVGNDEKVARASVEVYRGEIEVRADLDFEGGWTLTGDVLRTNGDPARGTRVVAIRKESGMATIGVVDQNGRFSMQGLETGVYEILVSSLGGKTLHREEIELSGDLDIVVELGEGAVSGVVVRDEDSRPIGDAEIMLQPRGGSVGFELGPGAAPSTRFDGYFQLDSVPPGTYLLTARAEGYTASSVEFTLEEGADVGGLELRLAPATGLDLYVYLPSGAPASRVALAVLDSREQPLYAGLRSATEGGRVWIEELAEGNWTLLISGGGGATLRVPASVPGDPLQLQLPESGALQVRAPFLVGSGTTVALQLVDESGRLYRSVESMIGLAPRAGYALVDGVASLPSLPVGMWTLSAGVSGTPSAVTTVVQAGRVTTVDLQ